MSSSRLPNLNYLECLFISSNHCCYIILSRIADDVVQLGVEYKPVYVSAVEHPEHFWLQVLSKKSAQLDKLVEEMTDFYGTQNLVNARYFLHFTLIFTFLLAWIDLFYW